MDEVGIYILTNYMLGTVNNKIPDVGEVVEADVCVEKDLEDVTVYVIVNDCNQDL